MVESVRQQGLTSYGSPLQFGHKLLTRVFEGSVTVEEKIDGSQFSAGWFAASEDYPAGGLRCRSKGGELNATGTSVTMFREAVETFGKLALEVRPGFTYRCEVVNKLRHNVLTYGRKPLGGVVVFDVQNEMGVYLERQAKEQECERLGLELTPCLFEGELKGPEEFLAHAENWLKQESLLGLALIEGVVVKNYARFTVEGGPLMAKLVREGFKEIQPGRGLKSVQRDFIAELVARYRTNARWQKAVQHLLERGELKGEPKDIGALCKEVVQDTRLECGDEIREAVETFVWKGLSKGLVAGLAEWYKAELQTKGAVDVQ